MEQFDFLKNNIENIDPLETYFELANVKVCEKQLEKLLKNVEVGADFFQGAAALLYKMLTRRSSFVAQTDTVDKTAVEVMEQYTPQKQWYRKTRDAIESQITQEGIYTWESNPGWFGINTRPEEPARNEINTKIYVTIPTKEYTYSTYILALAKQLRELAIQSDDSIKVKIPESLSGFISHNDSLVIHFKNTDNIQKISDIVSSWMQTHNIHEEEREMGRTKVAADSNTKSFSVLVSENIANWLVDNYGLYDTQTLIHEGIKHAISQSQKPPIIVGQN